MHRLVFLVYVYVYIYTYVYITVSQHMINVYIYIYIHVYIHKIFAIIIYDISIRVYHSILISIRLYQGPHSNSTSFAIVSAPGGLKFGLDFNAHPFMVQNPLRGCPFGP